jgi:D-alanyl-D-alanine carboxypeptidase/D-alanyl-D-alanine-endopeptidase (penicillin-binding protein 4)
MSHVPISTVKSAFWPRALLRLGRIAVLLLVAFALAMPADAATRKKSRSSKSGSAKVTSSKSKSTAKKSTAARDTDSAARQGSDDGDDDDAPAPKRRAHASSRSRGSSGLSGIAAWEAGVRRAEESLDEQWTVHVEDLYTSRVVYAYHPTLRLAPASNRKLITLALALETLGPDYLFSTEFGLSQPHTPGNSHYHGDLVLRSQGDPSLGFPMEGAQQNPRELFNEWARKLRETGIYYVHGDLVVDGSAFGVDQNHYPEHWGPNHRNQAYAPIPSAVALCQNLLRIQVRPGSIGRVGRLVLFPSDEGLSIVNDTRTSSRGGSVGAKFDEDSGDLIVSGRVDDGRGDEIMVPLVRPLNFAGALMQAALEDAGIRLLGSVRLELLNDTSDSTDTMREMLGAHVSPPLIRLLTVMMRNSNNFLAEQIWHAVGARAMGRGDLTRVRSYEQTWYRRKGLSWIEPGWDGCGLSTDNKFASSDMVAITRALYNSAYREFMLETLPESGRNGTLRNRSFDRGVGRVTAKTGTLNNVSALTGFINDGAGNPRYIFSIMGNARAESSSRLAGRINVLVEELIRQLDAESN